MKLRFGVLLLLIAASVFMQQVLKRDILDTILLLGAVYIIGFWIFNFLKKRAHETDLKPDKYIRMNRIAAAYSRKSSKAETAALLSAAQGCIDKGDVASAKEQWEAVTPYLSYQPASIQHLYKIIQGYIALMEKDVRGAQKAVAKSPLDNQILDAQKREVAFVRALVHLVNKDKNNAKEQLARLNEPKNNRQQLLRLFALGWLFNQSGDHDRAIQAMLPILENGKNLWIYPEAEKLKAASESKKEYALIK